jgi:hypothetical protein
MVVKSIRRCGGARRPERLTGDQQDAHAGAAWMRQADLDGRLAEYLGPCLTEEERKKAEIEGWILGIK